MIGICDLLHEMKKVSEARYGYGARLSLWRAMSALVRNGDFPSECRMAGVPQGVSISSPCGARILFAPGNGSILAYWLRPATSGVDLMEMDIGAGEEAAKAASEMLWNTAVYEEDGDDAEAGQI